jgi:hypothetical protein
VARTNERSILTASVHSNGSVERVWKLAEEIFTKAQVKAPLLKENVTSYHEIYARHFEFLREKAREVLNDEDLKWFLGTW